MSFTVRLYACYICSSHRSVLNQFYAPGHESVLRLMATQFSAFYKMHRFAFMPVFSPALGQGTDLALCLVIDRLYAIYAQTAWFGLRGLDLHGLTIVAQRCMVWH